MPAPRLARNFPTGVSGPRAASSSIRPSPTRRSAMSAPCSSSASRSSTSAPNRRRYVSTARSRSSTAIPTWWRPPTGTRAMLPAGSSPRAGLALVQRPDDADRLGGARLGLDVAEDREQLVARERLLLEQRVRDAVEERAMLRDQPNRLTVRLVGEPRLLLVAHAFRLLREGVVVGADRPRRRSSRGRRRPAPPHARRA